MKPKLLLGLALVLSGVLFCHLAAAQAPGKTAPPAAKDAYVAAQLAKLFAGAPVHVALRDAFDHWLSVEVSAPPDAKVSTNSLATASSACFLFAFGNEAAARDEVRQELTFFKQPAALTNSGYDEFYFGKREEMIQMIGRRGAVVVQLRSNQAERFDAVFGAIATNLSANPVLLSNLIHYACTMHFGDPAPLRVVLSKLNDKLPELTKARFSTISPFYADNAAVADYHIDSNNDELTIIAKAYDSEAAARAGQERDQHMIQAGGWNKKEIIRSVQVYEYTDYGTMYFQTGPYTFKLMTTRYSRDNVPPLLKAGSELIAAFAPPAKQP